MAGSILLVEDEENLASLVRAYLEQEGYRVVWAGSGAEALRTFESEPVRLVVLDLNLPDMDGVDLCKQIRVRSSVPVVMLTARDEEADRLAGLDAGADDYMGKPFSPRELVARMKAVLRRAAPDTDDRMLVLGDVVLRRAAREVGVGGEPVELRPKEFDLLAYLMENRGAVLSRDLLLERVWGYDYAGETRTVDVHVHWLRAVIEEDSSRPALLRTVRGVGYVLRRSGT
jgi:DNA-binding response OmpR family regulator